MGDLVHGAVEGLLVGLRRLGRARDLADVLQRGGVHLVGGCRGLEVVEGVDVAAHASDDTPGWASVSRPSGHQGSSPRGATSRMCGSSVGKQARNSSVMLRIRAVVVDEAHADHDVDEHALGEEHARLVGVETRPRRGRTATPARSPCARPARSRDARPAATRATASGAGRAMLSSSTYASPMRLATGRSDASSGEREPEHAASAASSAVLHRREEELLLGAEQPHDVGLADAGGPRDLVGGGAVVAAAPKTAMAAARICSRRSSRAHPAAGVRASTPSSFPDSHSCLTCYQSITTVDPRLSNHPITTNP